MRSYSHRRQTGLKHRQRGISLLVVMVMIMLSMLLVMGGTRLAVLNESLAGNDTDYQRALEAAQAMLADGELDVLGQDIAGNACAGASCRTTASVVFFPTDLMQYQTLIDQLTALPAGTPPCINGICMDLGTQTSGDPTTSFWNNAATLTAFTGANRGATYGQYTGATYAANSGNVLLNPATPQAWYWVEVLQYNTAAAVGGGNAAIWSPSPTQPFVYRITALARGRKAGTLAVVQSTTIPDPLR